MTIIELKKNGTLKLPEEIYARVETIRYFQIKESDKGILLVPLEIRAAQTTNGNRKEVADVGA
ncbi:MAG: hypothetical protein HRU10_15305 [Opitutales bacterium]|nr:hypothetical protein [Gammaproteobacteria bacterium]NRA28600.1 hypothetical protein [Opitutales bacterium]